MSSVQRLAVAVLVAALAGEAAAVAQARRGAQPATVTEAPAMKCPNVLGEGVRTRRIFCDVTIGRDPAGGIVIPLPPHTGPVTLRFDLHARHTYSEELAQTNRGFRRYTAGIGVLTTDNTLLSRAVVHTEFRKAADLFDRVSGGAGAGDVKAVAPIGSESIVVTIPAEETSVSILGERLREERLDATDEFTALGRPVAVISNVTIEYRPAPARRR